MKTAQTKFQICSSIALLVHLENEKLIDKIIEFGADVNARDMGGLTPLMYAVRHDGKVCEF